MSSVYNVKDIAAAAVRKQSVDEMTVEELFNDNTVKAAFSYMANQDSLFGMDIALMEAALYDLHLHRDEIFESLEPQSGDNVIKLHRAVAKTYYKMKREGYDVHPSVYAKYLTVSKKTRDDGSKKSEPERRFITIPEYTRQSDGVVVTEHKREIPRGLGHKSIQMYEEIKSELEQVKEEHQWVVGSENQGDWEDKFKNAIGVFLDAPDYMRRTTHLDPLPEEGSVEALQAEALREVSASEREANQAKYEAAYKTLFVDGDFRKMGRGIADSDNWLGRFNATADYFISKAQDKTSNVQFAAKAIKEYGPVAGLTMLSAYMRYGGYDVPMRESNGQVYTEKGDALPAVTNRTDSREWAKRMLASRLPNQKTYDSRSEPPSEGFLIDADGNIVAHAVGRGNDHFLPFNTKHLKTMKNMDKFEYVRSRMTGGITQEDLHVAMLLGADKVTVVSNGGTFSLDLTKRSHGIKLEHMQVLTRYQEILDGYELSNTKSKYGGKSKGLDANGYYQALQAISDEFPLHLDFNQLTNVPGVWADKADYVKPKHRFLDQLATIFGVNKDNRKNQKGQLVTSSASMQARVVNPLHAGEHEDFLDGLPWKQHIERFRENLVVAGHDPGKMEYMRQTLTELIRIRDEYRNRENRRATSEVNSRIKALQDQMESLSGVQQTAGVKQNWQVSDAREEHARILADSPAGTIAVSQVEPNPTLSGTQLIVDWRKERREQMPKAMTALEQYFDVDTFRGNEDNLEALNLLLGSLEDARNVDRSGMSVDDYRKHILEDFMSDGDHAGIMDQKKKF